MGEDQPRGFQVMRADRQTDSYVIFRKPTGGEVINTAVAFRQSNGLQINKLQRINNGRTYGVPDRYS